jgi:Tfp pilus assembly protein PilF
LQLCADVHIDAIAPAPDGQTIAVFTHSFAGEFSDTYPMRMLDAEAVASAAYNQAGLTHLAADNYPQAIDDFTHVTEIDPSDWKGAYNLACTHARAGNEDATRSALDEAIRRGGSDVRAKAAKDHDLDAMRERPWFPK